MKIEIEVNEDQYGSLKKLAAYAGTTPSRIIEALFSGLECQPLNDPLSETWEVIIDHVRETEGSSPRLDQIERYMKAHSEYNAAQVRASGGLRDEQLFQQEIALMRPYFKSLRAWLRLINETEVLPPGGRVPLIESRLF